MDTSPERPTSSADDFVRQGAAPRPSFFSDYLYFVKTSKKWWLLPLLVLLLGFGLLMVLSSTGAAPFIYTLF